MKTKQELLNERALVIKQARDICDRCDREGRDFTDDEKKEVQAAMGKAQKLNKKIKALDDPSGEKDRTANDDIRRQLEVFNQALNPGQGRQRSSGKGGAGVWSKAFMAARERAGRKELLSPSGTVGVPGLSATVPAVEERLETLIQAIGITETSDGAIKYLRETQREQAAAPVAAGAVKPVSTFKLEEITAALEVIAHLSEPVSRSWLSDAPNLERYLDTVLLQGLQLAAEWQAVNGSGTSPQLQGMLTVDDHVYLPADNGDVLRQARRGITALELQSLPLDGMVFAIHPNRWEDIELTEVSATDATYRFDTAPVDRAKRQLWGAPVAPSIAVPEDRLVLFHKSSLEMFEKREGAGIEWSDSFIVAGDGYTPDTTGFARNLVQVRAESRFALCIYRPSGIVEIVLQGGS